MKTFRWAPLVEAPEALASATTRVVEVVGDLFAPDIPFKAAQQVYATMVSTDRVFLMLTDHPERAGQLYRRLLETHGQPDRRVGENTWLGVRVKTQADAEAKLPALLAATGDRHRSWVKVVPVDPIRLDKWLRPGSICGCGMERGTTQGCQPKKNRGGDEIGWIRCDLGMRRLLWVDLEGESGAGSRPLNSSWVQSLAKQCEAPGVKIPFRFSGWGDWCPRTPGYPIVDDVPRVRLTVCGCNSSSDVSIHGVPGGETRHSCDLSGDEWVNRAGADKTGRDFHGQTFDGVPAEFTGEE